MVKCDILFYFILFYFILFYFIFYFILFYFILYTDEYFCKYSLPCFNIITPRFQSEMPSHIDIVLPCLLNDTQPYIIGKQDFLKRSENENENCIIYTRDTIAFNKVDV